MQLIGALVLRNIFQLKMNSSIVLLKRKIWTDWIYLELMLLSGGMKSMQKFQTWETYLSNTFCDYMYHGMEAGSTESYSTTLKMLPELKDISLVPYFSL